MKEKMTLKERLDLIKTRLIDKDFLANKGLSNEVGFYFFCYDAEDEMVVRNYLNKLKTENDKDYIMNEYNLIEHDLFEVFLQILEEKRVLKSVSDLEIKKGKEYLLKQIQKIANANAFVDKLKYTPHELGDVLVLTGVGKVFPFIRTDQLMESLQAHFQDMPVLVFYPGDFTGTGIKLFNRLQIRPYYRAFDLL